MLYRSTDRLCRAGAAVKNLAHSASLHANEDNAPPNARTKHILTGVVADVGNRGVGNKSNYLYEQSTGPA